LAATLLALAFIAGINGPAAAQVPAAAEPYLVLTQSSLAEIASRLAVGGREDLVGKLGGTETTMMVQHDAGRKGEAEVHRDADDYHFVIAGAATYTLGGTLDAPKQTKDGEWRAASISGGKLVELKKGDMIFLPRGTPHQRDTTGKDVSVIVIKVLAEPAPKVTPAR
jgi:mannose-6-phosphate isomerase-like protein (cupin superfamily)